MTISLSRLSHDGAIRYIELLRLTCLPALAPTPPGCWRRCCRDLDLDNEPSEKPVRMADWFVPSDDVASAARFCRSSCCSAMNGHRHSPVDKPSPILLWPQTDGTRHARSQKASAL